VNAGAERVYRLTLAGAADSLGLALGWTVVNLLAVHRYGLAGAGLLNAAMLLGVALSSPTAAWLTRHVHGRHLLQGTAVTEALLRVWTLALLFMEAPLYVVAVCVLLTNVIAWVSYAGMRAEVARARAGAIAMTRYVAVIVAVEAVGTTIGALLPIVTNGHIDGVLVYSVIFLYGVSLVPTVMVAGGSTIPVVPRASAGDLTARSKRLLGAGTLLMVVCSGPVLLFIALADKLHGHAAVAPAAIAFAAGSIVAPSAGRLIARSGLPLMTLWLTWGAGMVFGWIAAPWNVYGLCFALFLSGICLTGFEGAMDTLLAAAAPAGRATASLAHGSAARALGGAAAVKLVPFFSSGAALAELAAVSAVALAVGAVAVHLVVDGRFAAVPAPNPVINGTSRGVPVA
jgi:hypothetical protein